MQFFHLTREYDVRFFFTGLTSTDTFKSLYYVFLKSSVMSYWEGPKRSSLLPNDRLDSVAQRVSVSEGSILDNR